MAARSRDGDPNADGYLLTIAELHEGCLTSANEVLLNAVSGSFSRGVDEVIVKGLERLGRWCCWERISIVQNHSGTASA